MKIYRFRYRKKILFGVLKEEFLFPVKGSVFRDFRIGDSPIPMGEVRLLAPVEPSKIVGIGRNYHEHAREMGNAVPAEPLIFLKPPTAVIGPLDEIRYPDMSSRVDYEGELAVVIRKKARGLREDEPVDDYILGYTCANDVTARDLQRRDGQWTRGKGFDTFCPLGPHVVVGLAEEEVRDLAVSCRVNGALRQHGHTGQMVFPPAALVEYISAVMTLEPGDVILTGTPAGVGPLVPGDTVEVEVERIGVLSNPVR